MPDTIDGQEAAVLVGQVKGLRQAVCRVLGVATGYLKLGVEEVVVAGDEAKLLAVVFGEGLRVFEDIGAEEFVVRFRGIVEEPGALRMQLQGELEPLECLIDLEIQAR